MLKYMEKIKIKANPNLPFVKNNYPKLEFETLINDENREYMTSSAINVLESLLL